MSVTEHTPEHAPEKVSPIVDHVAGASTEDGSGTEFRTARHYGTPLVEQTRVDEGESGVVDGWDRSAVLVSGPEAASWLNGFISQKIDAIPDGSATHGLLLDAQGRVEQLFGIAAVAPETLLLDVADDSADALMDFLRKMIFWAQVEVNPAELVRISVVNPGTDSEVAEISDPDTGLARAGAGSPLPSVDGELVAYWSTRTAGGRPVVDLWVAPSDQISVWDALVASGARPTGGWALDALRVRDRWPELGIDTDERLIPHEVTAFLGADILAAGEATRLAEDAALPTATAVHLNKGCYRGQETVSRVHNLGRPPRQLVVLQLDGSAQRAPETGAPVTAGGRTVGRVGRTVQDADFGPVALALVKRQVIEKLAAGEDVPPLSVDGIDASVDPDDVRADTSVRPGKAAIDRLKGRA
ncbi:MAG TPA: folate-binding protein [Candidatus Corynebacterium avicola]|uniref:Folate-binding protein n=1 Tax=Candidatus Corynebacterium avicola TaxID=2838527 RepID=A0A9D1RMM0_9CORY|nr:folate-binding protein [Candidatus Corynebacterium avicola]